MVGVKKALESLYTGVCDVYEFGPSKDPVTNITKHQEQLVHAAAPCRLSFSTTEEATQGDGPAIVSQVVKLFIAPDLEIKPGSKIVITQNGRTFEYASSGAPAVYTNHQEVVLVIFKGWS